MRVACEIQASPAEEADFPSEQAMHSPVRTGAEDEEQEDIINMKMWAGHASTLLL